MKVSSYCTTGGSVMLALTLLTSSDNAMAFQPLHTGASRTAKVQYHPPNAILQDCPHDKKRAFGLSASCADPEDGPDVKKFLPRTKLFPKLKKRPGDKKAPLPLRTTHRAGNWMAKDNRIVSDYIGYLKKKAAARPMDTALTGSVVELMEFVQQNEPLYNLCQAMFQQSQEISNTTPDGQNSVENWEEFCILLDVIVTSEAPRFTYDEYVSDPSGLVGFPINALLDWPMATEAGSSVFAYETFNLLFRRVLNTYTEYLETEASTNVLKQGDPDAVPPYAPWSDPQVKTQLVSKVTSAFQSPTLDSEITFEDIFQTYDNLPFNEQDAGGYPSWDSFFVREFQTGIRPVAEPGNNFVVANACESAPLNISTNVEATGQFWIKNMQYSLSDMLNEHSSLPEFVGGTVYQAFLSALSYHCWKSPIDGTVVDAFVVPGTYYLEDIWYGFKTDDPDPVAPNDSQVFLSAVATRAVIILENEEIGKIAFVGIGMAEVSSCDITVDIGSTVTKGQEIGKFHFGGSTHCVVFNNNLDVTFSETIPPLIGTSNENNVAISSKLADVSLRSS